MTACSLMTSGAEASPPAVIGLFKRAWRQSVVTIRGLEKVLNSGPKLKGSCITTLFFNSQLLNSCGARHASMLGSRGLSAPCPFCPILSFDKFIRSLFGCINPAYIARLTPRAYPTRHTGVSYRHPPPVRLHPLEEPAPAQPHAGGCGRRSGDGECRSKQYGRSEEEVRVAPRGGGAGENGEASENQS